MTSDDKGIEPKEVRTVPVNIFGHPYSLRSDEDPSYVESLAAYVDRHMREVADRTRTADTLKIAILSALNIADELHRGRAEAGDPAPDVRERAGRIEALLDGALSDRP